MSGPTANGECSGFRRRIAIIGPLPPPLNGMTVMTAHAIEAARRNKVDYVHVDTSDHREVGNVGRLDLRNVALAIQHAFSVCLALSRYKPRIMYLPIAQEALGFLRDTLFFVAARSQRIPCVVHFHGAEFDRFYKRSPPAMAKLIRWCLSDPVRMIVLGRSLEGIFSGIVEPDHVEIVSNGIPPLPRFIPRRTERHPPTVLFLSNLAQRKGYPDVVAAAKLVTEEIGDAQFVIAGEWPSREEKARGTGMVDRLGIAHAVRFVPRASGLRKAELFWSSDVFVFPARRPEGQGLVILEAMSAGLPVVATRLGGIRDTITDGVSGLLVEPSDPQGLAEAILRLLRDEDLRRKIGGQALAEYERLYTDVVFQRALMRALGEVSAIPTTLPATLSGVS